MKYIKKPIEVEAMQLFQTDFDFIFSEKLKEDNRISGFYYEYMGAKVWVSKGRDGIVKARIKTLEGDHRISDGDFLIRGIKGEYYPCKPDIFEQTYQLVEKSA